MTQGVNVAIKDGWAEVEVSRQAGERWMGAAQRARLIAILKELDPHLKAVVLCSADRVLAAFADGGPDLPGPDDAIRPTVADLCLALDACAVPVVVLMEGPVAGAMADIALAAQARIATPGARISFCAARLDRISGAGSTQRLPRLIGAEQALRLLSQAKPIPAPEALVIGLLDHIVDVEPPQDARAAAGLWVLQQAFPLRRPSGLSDGRAVLRAVGALRAGQGASGLMLALADCVEAALLLPLEQGLAFEAALAAERDALPGPAALAHLMQAERAAAAIPAALAAVTVAAVARPAFAGASTSMTSLALMTLARGLPLKVFETERSRLVPMLQGVVARHEAAVQAGTLSADQRDADWARLLPVTDPSSLGQADLVIVAPDAARPSVGPATPLLVMGRGDLPKGAFRLVLSGKVAELAVPPSSPAKPAAQARAFLRRIGHMVVLTGVQSPLGISGRLARAGGAALRGLMDLGVAPEQIDAALSGFGVKVPALPQTEPASAPRLMSGDEIVARWLAALANEGARLLACGLAQSAADIDLVAVHGLGLPPGCGGPLYQADQRGLLILRRDLRLWGEDAEVWKPTPALDALVSVGRGFSQSLSRG